MKKFQIIFYVLFILLGITAIFILICGDGFQKDFRKLVRTKHTKLMVVAHPDDDMLWGGAHLLNDNYFVVCVTCGSDKRRAKEFRNAMKATGNDYVMLGYPDKRKGKRDNWDGVRKDIVRDISKIVHYRKWELIVTHNPDGEYGHIHHKMTSQIVTDLVDKNHFYYFGRYYKKGAVPNDLSSIDETDYYKKVKDIFPIYESQKKVLQGFKHMWKYENWVRYQDW